MTVATQPELSEHIERLGWQFGAPAEAGGFPRPRNILGGDCGRDGTDNFIQGRSDFEETVKRLAAFTLVGVDVLYAYPSTWAGFGRS